MEGGTDGIIVGRTVGSTEGRREGERVGHFVGANEGGTVGERERVGGLVGRRVLGLAVGLREGEPITGNAVGRHIGVLVGTRVGGAVEGREVLGTRVGRTVGAKDGAVERDESPVLPCVSSAVRKRETSMEPRPVTGSHPGAVVNPCMQHTGESLSVTRETQRLSPYVMSRTNIGLTERQ